MMLKHSFKNKKLYFNILWMVMLYIFAIVFQVKVYKLTVNIYPLFFLLSILSDVRQLLFLEG